MGGGGLRVQLEYGVRTRARHLASEPHEPLVPHLQDVSSFLTGRDLLQEAVALLQHTFQPGQGSRVARPDLHQHLVEETTPELCSCLDDPQAIGPQNPTPKSPRQIQTPSPPPTALPTPS